MTTRQPQGVGNLIKAWETGKRTRYLRVPLLFKIVGMCSGFGEDNEGLRQQFADRIIHFAIDLHIDPMDHPLTRQPEPTTSTDHSLGKQVSADLLRQFEEDGFNVLNRLCIQIDFIHANTLFKFASTDALVMTSRIVCRRYGAHFKFEVFLLIFSNTLRYHLAVIRGCYAPPFPPSLLPDIDDPRRENRISTADQIRGTILKYLGSNNVLVGVYVGWLLAAVHLLICATPVVDLSVEP